MKSLSPNKVSLSTGTKLFINESLSLYYQVIWSKCKNLLRSKYTFSFYTANVTIQIKNHENSSSNVITPGDELILFTLKSPEDLNGTSGLLDTNLFFYSNSLHARLNSNYKAWNYKKKKHNKIKAYVKSLQKEPTVNRRLLILDLKPFRLLVKGKHSIGRESQSLAVRGKKLLAQTSL